MKQHPMSVTHCPHNTETTNEVTTDVCITSEWYQVMTAAEVVYNWRIIKTM
jgi:hypothetical protein